jgi:hypothetical protein
MTIICQQQLLLLLLLHGSKPQGPAIPGVNGFDSVSGGYHGEAPKLLCKHML